MRGGKVGRVLHGYKSGGGSGVVAVPKVDIAIDIDRVDGRRTKWEEEHVRAKLHGLCFEAINVACITFVPNLKKNRPGLTYLGLRHPNGCRLLLVDEIHDLVVPGVCVHVHAHCEDVAPQLLEFLALL